MATQEEIIKLLMQVQGVDEVKRLHDANEQLRAEIVRLSGAMQGQTAAQMAADPQMRAAAEQLRHNTERMRELNAATGQVGKGANSAAYKLQVFGQGLDDFQYVGEQGLRPIINNLMQISPLLGIAAIAINTVGIPAVKALWEAFTSEKVKEAGESIDELKAKIKTLEDKKTRLSFEDEELDATKKKLEEALEAKKTLDGLLGNQTEKEKASGKAIRDVMSTAAGRDRVEKAKQTSIDTLSPADQKRLDDANKKMKHAVDFSEASGGGVQYMVDEASEELKSLKKVLKEKGSKAFAAILNSAVNGIADGTDKDQVKNQDKLAALMKATDPKGEEGGVGAGMAADVAYNSPEALAERKRLEEKKKADEKKAAEAKRAQDKTDAEQLAFDDAETAEFNRRNALAKAARLKNAANNKKEQSDHDKDVDATAKPFAAGTMGKSIAEAIRGGMEGGVVREKTVLGLQNRGVDPALVEEVADQVIADIRATLKTEGDKAAPLPVNRPRATKIRPRTVEQRTEAARTANRARKAAEAKALAARKAVLAASRKPKSKRRNVAGRDPNSKPKPERQGPPAPIEGQFDPFVNLQAVQAQQTGVVIQNQTSLSNRIMSVESQLEANRGMNRIFHQRQRTNQLFMR